jgi:hypothetical protein
LPIFLIAVVHCIHLAHKLAMNDRRRWSWAMWPWLSCVVVFYVTLIAAESNSNGKVATEIDSNNKYADTYKRLVSCLQTSKFLQGKDTSKWAYPADAEAHYKMLLEQTHKFREGIPIHEGPAGYLGPWVENIFNRQFMQRELSSFNGIIPLFLSWTDIHVYQFEEEAKKNKTIPTKEDTTKRMIELLRPDVIYLAISQDDQGLFESFMEARPNVLVLSAGGYGHIPIPLIKGEMNYSEPPNKYAQDVGFFGNVRPRLSRVHMLDEMKQACASEGLTTKVHQTIEWENEIKRSKFNLAPRGYGRTSYRLAEVVQIGRVPVYMYDDHPWLPYEGTNISINTFGFSEQMGHMRDTAKRMKALTEAQHRVLLQQVRAVREHYTYEGVMRQIEAFLRDPLGVDGGQLRCAKLHDRDHR